MDMDDQATEPRVKIDPMQGQPPAQPVSTLPLETTQPLQQPEAAPQATSAFSRRTFMGKSIAGLAALGGAGIAAAAGGVALEQWLQHGGLINLFHGPMANSSQIGHLLRRAGFGATPDELSMYRNLGLMALWIASSITGRSLMMTWRIV